ncbi:TPA: plasmid recombination protein [Vibrio parahaemolyticus]|nr:plasmid recombination protein [Vibrio parahaemolyticus]
MGTTILRVEKLKSMANIRQSGAHIHRHHANTPNADPALKHRNIRAIGSTNLASDVQARLDTLSKPPRKNAVLAVDGILSLSPDLLKNEENVKKWGNAALGWLREEFGENLVSVVLHRDESTPHLHFTVVPVDEKENGRRVLNARDMFDKWKLAEMQRSYNKAIQKRLENVQEPNYGSKARHTTIAQFYEVLNAEQDNLVRGIVGRLREHLEAGMASKFDALLQGLDSHVSERMDRTGDEMQEKLREFYKALRAEAVRLSEEDYQAVRETAEGAFVAVEDPEITELVNAAMRAAIDRKPSTRRGASKQKNRGLAHE